MQDPAIPVLVINLERSPARLAHMQAELGAIGIAFERIQAVDGVARALGNEDWDISAAEVGCFQSHRAAWQRVVDASWPFAIVMEDDVRVHSSFGPLVSDASWVPERCDLVKLDTRATVVWLGRPAARAQDMDLRPIHSPTYGAGAYLLRRDAARRLLDATPEARIPVDLFMYGPAAPRRWSGMDVRPGLRVLHASPSPVIAMHRVEDRPERASLLAETRTFAAGARRRWKARRGYRLTRPLRAMLQPLRRLGARVLRPWALRACGVRPQTVPYADGHQPAR